MDNNLTSSDEALVYHSQGRPGKIEVVHEDWALDWKPENGKKIMNAALTKAGRAIDAVVASNDGIAVSISSGLSFARTAFTAWWYA